MFGTHLFWSGVRDDLRDDYYIDKENSCFLLSLLSVHHLTEVTILLGSIYLTVLKVLLLEETALGRIHDPMASGVRRIHTHPFTVSQ